MGATSLDGPLFIFGANAYLQAGLGGSPVPDYDFDAGPSVFYKGIGVPDIRQPFLKDKVGGYKGRVPAHLLFSQLHGVNAIPAALGTANIAAAANAVSGTAMTLVSTNSVGVTCNIPIMPWSGTVNGAAPVTAPIVLDFGFAFGTGTAASQTVTVADSTQFNLQMPLVIANAGNAGGTAPLLTWVTGMPTATTITINDPLVAAITAQPIGTGNVWAPFEGVNAAYPTAHLPYQAHGPGLFLDPSQAIARAISITGATSGTGGTFTVRGWDLYWQPMTQTVTVGAGAVTGYSAKAFKAVLSVTPNFSDAHTYSVGTSDVFGLPVRSEQWEMLEAYWAGLSMTSTTGWTAFVGTNPATAATGDVRGTIQTGAAGGGSGIGSSASNGAVSSLAMTGRRLCILQGMSLFSIMAGSPFNSTYMYGVTQV